MNKEIEVSPYGNMLVFKKDYDAEFVKTIIKEHRLSGLRILDHLAPLDSLDFLKEYSFLQKLDIDSIKDHDYSFLANLEQLKHLKIGISVEQEHSIDLSNQKKLETLGINWRKKIIGLENCTSLTTLTISDFNEDNLQKIEGLKRLVELQIKTGTINSLSGIEKLTNLRKLEISGCQKLESLIAINHLPSLKDLGLDACSNINDYMEVTDLPSLETLSLIDCGGIQSLKFIEQYHYLENLFLLGNTVIVDGDLASAKLIKSLKHKHYSHYNLHLENPSYNQNVINNLQKIKKWLK